VREAVARRGWRRRARAGRIKWENTCRGMLKNRWCLGRAKAAFSVLKFTLSVDDDKVLTSSLNIYRL
jgi:hypothetical protein